MPATLSDLPLELISEILIESHCSSLFLLNRRLNSYLRAASNRDRAKYLLNACRSHFRNRRNGWEKVLDYCTSFPICNHVVLKLLNTWIVDQGVLDSVLDLPELADLKPPEPILSFKQFLPLTAMPKRLFRTKDGKASTTYPDGFTPNVPYHLEDLFDDNIATFAHPSEAPWWPLRCALSYIASADKKQIMPLPDLMLFLTLSSLHTRQTWPFDRGLCLYALCSPRFLPHEYPLTRAVFDRNFGLCSLLLAFGARPSLEQGLAVTVACRQNWLEGFQLLASKNRTEQTRWDRAREIILWWILDQYEDGLDSEPSPRLRQAQAKLVPYGSESDARQQEVFDRRPTQAHFRALRERTTPIRSKHSPYGAKRAEITSYHVLEAIRHNSHQVAEYIMKRTKYKPSMLVIQEMEAYLAKMARRDAKRKSTQMLTDGEEEEVEDAKPTNKAPRI